MDPAAELKEQIRKNLITAGGFPQQKVDEVFKSSEILMPPELVHAYLQMQLDCIKFRLAEDTDFEAAEKDQFSNLKKLV